MRVGWRWEGGVQLPVRAASRADGSPSRREAYRAKLKSTYNLRKHWARMGLPDCRHKRDTSHNVHCKNFKVRSWCNDDIVYDAYRCNHLSNVASKTDVVEREEGDEDGEEEDEALATQATVDAAAAAAAAAEEDDDAVDAGDEEEEEVLSIIIAWSTSNGSEACESSSAPDGPMGDAVSPASRDQTVEGIGGGSGAGEGDMGGRERCDDDACRSDDGSEA